MTILKLDLIYKMLFNKYGPQGWWPIYKSKEQFQQSSKAYHPENYAIPKKEFDRFQIITGAILTQNTNWKNVVLALEKLWSAKINSFYDIQNTDINTLAEKIKSSGYYNQKAKKLKFTASYFINQKTAPTRERLLKLWGIGEETADSILLYAYHLPFFVIDTYTRRFLSRMNIIGDPQTKYCDIQEIFHTQLKGDIIKYIEYHALIVKHAKENCRKKPYCSSCLFIKKCKQYESPDRTL